MEKNVKTHINNYRLGDNNTKLEIVSMQYSYIQALMAYRQFSAAQKQQLAQQFRQNNSTAGAFNIEAYSNQQQANQLMSQIIQMGNISRHNKIESLGSGDKTYYSFDYNSPLSW